MIALVCWLFQLYFFVILARIVLSWFPLSPGGAVSSIYGVLFTLTEPLLGAVRRVIPMARFGGMGIDFSPIIVIFGLQIIASFIC